MIDYSKYPDNWKTEIVPRILKRAKGKCEICEVSNKAYLYSVPLRVCFEGKYKVKRIWITFKNDIIRLKNVISGGEIKTIKVVLTIAHLDHDETNHNVGDDRLMAMCQYCHLNYDVEEKRKRKRLTK